MSEITDALGCFRAAGLFARENRSEEVLAEEIARDHAARWGEELAEVAPAELREALVLAHDRDRVWMEDLERDVAPQTRAYAEAIAEWARISAGALVLAAVGESWDAPLGPVGIRVESARGGTATLEPEARADWLDLSILAGLNSLLEEERSPRRFATVRIDAQTALVCALSAAERSLIEAERPLRFEVPG